MGFEPTISSVTGRRDNQATLQPHFYEFLKHYLLPVQEKIAVAIIHNFIKFQRITHTEL